MASRGEVEERRGEAEAEEKQTKGQLWGLVLVRLETLNFETSLISR